MTWARDLLREAEKVFPAIGEGRHALVYDALTDSMVLFLNIYGGFRPIGFTDDEFEKDPIQVIADIKTLVDTAQGSSSED